MSAFFARPTDDLKRIRRPATNYTLHDPDLGSCLLLRSVMTGIKGAPRG